MVIICLSIFVLQIITQIYCFVNKGWKKLGSRGKIANMEGKPGRPEDLDRIPIVDPELEAQRRTRSEAKIREETNSPSIDVLPPVDPHTGGRTELLPGRPKASSYPGNNPPRPMPMGGAKDD